MPTQGGLFVIINTYTIRLDSGILKGLKHPKRVSIIIDSEDSSIRISPVKGCGIRITNSGAVPLSKTGYGTSVCGVYKGEVAEGVFIGKKI